MIFVETFASHGKENSSWKTCRCRKNLHAMTSELLSHCLLVTVAHVKSRMKLVKPSIYLYKAK
ncbi:hypothetical protein Ccrd_016152 [Cynara cardunculus var. scolymus]|uniref:Uncharacterized protein n=1 Tax=Cynara cardunculus var. scolymus TaxID=59895 RepID=A0A103YAF7_CYNCS|nr:hypothetical protein Ccrd_016152 [Cynara cardunculus var. scolymus]